MAVRFLKPEAPPDENRLKQGIITELEKNETNGQQPIIEIETTSRNRTRITVVWDDWKNLDQGQRSTIIMAAFEEHYKAKGEPEKLQNVTIAMGLTSKEAERLGFT